MELYREAIERYGEHRQLVKVCEELAELQQAICKLFDGPCSGDDIEAVVEEMADVSVVLDELCLALDTGAQAKRVRRAKITRTVERYDIKES